MFDNSFKFGDKDQNPYMNYPLQGGMADDIVNFEYKAEDVVNHPSHYTQGTQEAIDIIEEAIEAAPSVQAGMLQAQVLKYLLRIWHKDNPAQDARKALWYLTRLSDSLN